MEIHIKLKFEGKGFGNGQWTRAASTMYSSGLRRRKVNKNIGKQFYVLASICLLLNT